MTQEEHTLAIQEFHYKQEINNNISISNRGRSLLVGTCFNEMVEVSMRGDGDKRLWVILDPLEVGELIHQLAATIGCTATVTQRTDFLAFRKWNQNKQ